MNRTMRNFVLGLVAGSVALVVSAVFRIFAGRLFIPNLPLKHYSHILLGR